MYSNVLHFICGGALSKPLHILILNEFESGFCCCSKVFSVKLTLADIISQNFCHKSSYFAVWHHSLICRRCVCVCVCVCVWKKCCVQTTGTPWQGLIFSSCLLLNSESGFHKINIKRDWIIDLYYTNSWWCELCFYRFLSLAAMTIALHAQL